MYLCIGEKMKVVSDQLDKFYYYSFPMQAVLVTCRDEQNKTNVITIAWHTPISRDPPLYGISVAPGRYSHTLIKTTEEFVVNFMPFDFVEKIHFCGTNSGRNINKIDEINLTYGEAKKIKTKIITEGFAHFECTLHDSIKIGDHTLFIGKIINVQLDDGSFVNNILDNNNIKPAYYLGGNAYTTIDKKTKKF